MSSDTTRPAGARPSLPMEDKAGTTLFLPSGGIHGDVFHPFLEYPVRHIFHNLLHGTVKAWLVIYIYDQVAVTVFLQFKHKSGRVRGMLFERLEG